VISVVVVTYNSARHVTGFVDALRRSAAGGPVRLVVVDNASTDRTVALVRAAAPDALVVELPRNAGYAAGINAGVAAVAGEGPVLVCNPDVRLRPGCAERLAAALTGRTGITAPKLVDEQGRLNYSLRRDATVRRALGEAVLGGTRARNFRDWGQIVGDEREYASSHAVDYAAGAVLMLSGECIADVGPWDESLLLYNQESDYCLRAREAGFEVQYVPDAVALHEGGDMHSSPALWSLQMRNKVRLFGRRHGALHTAAYRGALTLYELVRSPAPSGRVHREGLRVLLGGAVRLEHAP
jgi:GT2 family glycosyltransferase